MRERERERKKERERERERERKSLRVPIIDGETLDVKGTVLYVSQNFR